MNVLYIVEESKEKHADFLRDTILRETYRDKRVFKQNSIRIFLDKIIL